MYHKYDGLLFVIHAQINLHLHRHINTQVYYLICICITALQIFIFTKAYNKVGKNILLLFGVSDMPSVYPTDGII